MEWLQNEPPAALSCNVLFFAERQGRTILWYAILRTIAKLPNHVMWSTLKLNSPSDSPAIYQDKDLSHIPGPIPTCWTPPVPRKGWATMLICGFFPFVELVFSDPQLPRQFGSRLLAFFKQPHCPSSLNSRVNRFLLFIGHSFNFYCIFFEVSVKLG